MLISRSYLNRRRGMSAIVIAALVLLLSGCRTEGTPEPGAETATPSRTAASTATVTPSASPTADVNATATAIQREENEQALFENAEAEIRDVLMWLPPQFDPSLTDASGTALARLFAEIVENHPEIKITHRIKDTSGSASLINMLTVATSAAPSALPALMILDRNDMMTAVQKGLIFQIETKLFTEADSWFRYARESAVVDNVRYGIPVAGDPLVLVYRPALTGPDMNNWEEILTRGLPIGFEPNNVTDLFGMFIYLSLGGKTKDEQGKPWIDQEILTQTLNFFLNGGQKGAFPPAIAKDTNVGQSWQQFTDGTMQITVAKLSQYRHNQRADFTAIPIPLTDENGPYPLVNTWNVVVTTNDPEIMAIAVEIAEAMASPEFNDQWTHASGYLPVRTGDLTDWKSDAAYDDIYRMSASASLLPGSNILSKLVPILNSAISKVILTAASPEAAAREAIEALN